MDVDECVKKSIHIAMEYFHNNNYEPYFENMDENVIWHGPAIGQKIKGLTALREVWANFPEKLTFTLGDIEAEYIQTSNMSCEVILMYTITMHYPNGDAVPVFQRVQFSWADVNYTDENKLRKRVTKIFMINISTPTEYHNKDYIYPEHYNELYIKAEKPVSEPRMSLRGTDGIFYVIAVSSVIWAESTPKQYCMIHLRDRTITVKTTITDIEKKMNGYLIRLHSCYIVNPLDVMSVWRFRALLSDGTVLPIPEKKYTAIKRKLLKYNTPE